MSKFLCLSALLLTSVPVWCQTLPDGNGKQTVQKVCSTCHGLDIVVNAGHNLEGWKTTIDHMVIEGAVIPNDQTAVVAAYLAKNFPEKTLPSAAVIAGKTDVHIQEWDVHTFAHDPLAATDGTIWYTGQQANLLGRLDPKTGQLKEYPLKTAGSGPHGLIADGEGNIWFTANSKGYVGKLDPKTGGVTEYKVPGARDPHSLVFDQKGMLWFTVQGSNLLGRLNPRTGDVKVVASPTARSLPYGIVVNSQGVPFFDEFGSNKIGSIDPVTMEIHEYLLPNSGARPRRIAVSDDDVIWYSDYGRAILDGSIRRAARSRSGRRQAVRGPSLTESHGCGARSGTASRA